MGKSQSKQLDFEQNVAADGNSTMARAIARGRIYVIINYPSIVDTMEEVTFNDDQFRVLMLTIQQKFQDFEVTVDAGKMDRFSEHVTFYNSSDPDKSVSRPRVKVEVFYTGVYGGIDKRMLQSTIQETLDPEHSCFIDVRCELGRYHTTNHLETLLRI